MSLFVWALSGAMTFAAQEEGSAPVPAALAAFEGCWAGTGHVMGKPVVTTLNVKPIALGALKVFDASSTAVEDAGDRYEAHVIVGGTATREDGVKSYFADSFGGDYTALGEGQVSADGFEVTYRYPTALFVNRWTAAPTKAEWTIVTRDGDGTEAVFAAYDLTRRACPAV